jgi:UDP-N-acetylglucosamine acyltransferase
VPNIHPTAIIDAGARIDPSATVGPYAVIGPETFVGPRCTIGAHAVLECVQMGQDNRISPGAFIGVAPQDLKYAGEPTRLVLGDGNAIRECVTLNRGTSATGETRIGNGCLFMAYSHVAHDCRISDGVIMANSVALAGHVEVGERAVLGGLAAVHQFVRIGRYAMVGGGGMVERDILPFCLVRGYPAKLRGLNMVGLRRSGLKPEALRAIKEAYKTLFLSGLTLQAAFRQVKSASPSREVLDIIAFLENSKRGITRPAAGTVRQEETGL